MNRSFITDQIKKSIDIKSHVVFSDKYEIGYRKILNFGHTLGHAIESHFLTLNNQQHLLHGEAIAIGMILEAYLSTKLLGLTPYSLEEIVATCNQYFKLVPISKEQQKHIIDLLQHDKKTKNGQLQFVLLEAIGKATFDVVVDDFCLINEAFDEYARQSFGWH